MVTRDEAYPSEFFKASDLLVNGVYQDMRLTIGGIEWTTYADGSKARLLTFIDHPKKLGLNRTNWDAIVMLSQVPDDDLWIGLRPTLFMQPANHPNAGGMKPSVRIKAVDKPAFSGAGGTAPAPAASPAPAQPPAPASPASTTKNDDGPVMQFVTCQIHKVWGGTFGDRNGWCVETTSGKFGTFEQPQFELCESLINGSPQVEVGYHLIDGNRILQMVRRLSEVEVSKQEPLPFGG